MNDRKSVINMKFKKLICLIIAVILTLSATSVNMIAFAAGASYPDGITEKQAENAVSGTENLLSFILKDYMKTDMKSLIEGSGTTSF